MKKIISLILCLIMVAACFVSCVNEETEIADGTTEAPAPQILDLVVGGASSYEIIYPEQSTQQEANFIKTFTELFNEKTGVKLPKKDDFLKPGESRDADTCKIYIGATNHPMAQETYKNLQYQDFRIVTVGSNIILAAHTNTGFDGITRWFKKNVFADYTGGDLSMQAVDLHTSEIAGYPISDWTINGNPLKNYQIVFNDRNIANEVFEIQEQLAKKSGWFLKAGLDKDMPESEYEILIGETNRKENGRVGTPSALNYIITVEDNKLIFKYGGIHTREMILKDFVNIMIEGTDRVDMPASYTLSGDLYDDPNDSSLAEDADLRIMCANLMANSSGYDSGALGEHGFLFERRAEIFHAHIDYYQPTVIGFQEACTSWYDAIKSYENIDYWDVLEVKNPTQSNSENIFSSVMWRNDLYKLIDSGAQLYSAENNKRCRWYAWVILEDIKTKKQFCVVSTHWDGFDSENAWIQARELAAFVNEVRSTKNIPVFTMGDFNSNEWTKSFPQYCTDIDSYDCMKAFNDNHHRVNIVDSWHGWGVSDNGAVGGSCDHITATKSNVDVLKFETLVYLDQIWGSDHAWLLCDFKLK